jgi:isoamyl acetate esterase
MAFHTTIKESKMSVSTIKDTTAQILLLGDSLTQLGFEGWSTSLANVYQRRADVINRGCSGYNTKNFLEYIPLPACNNVCLVTIFFGANDASLLNENPRQHVPIGDYSRNLKILINSVNDTYNSPRILLINPPPLDHKQRIEFQKKRYGALATGRLERTTENTGLYAQACLNVGVELNIPCIDLFNIMVQIPNYGEFLNDGLHFSLKGHEFVAQQVLDAIKANFPEISITPCPVTGQYNNSSSVCPGLKSLGPYHDEIDPA